jgi:hypothetical protein
MINISPRSQIRIRQSSNNIIASVWNFDAGITCPIVLVFVCHPQVDVIWPSVRVPLQESGDSTTKNAIINVLK